MPLKFHRLPRFACFALLLTVLAVPVHAAPRVSTVHPAGRSTVPVLQPAGREPLVTLPTDISRSRVLHRSVPLGTLDAGAPVTAALSLPWRGGAALQDLIRQQNDPRSPLYKKWLTAAEFDARFAPSAADYAVVQNWAKGQGLTAVQTFPSRNLLVVRGTAGQAARAFSVQFGQFRLPDGRVAYANTTSPRLPRSVALVVSGVSGLDNLALRRPMFRRRAATPVPFLSPLGVSRSPFATGSAAGGLTPADIKSVYSLTSATLPTGTGQAIALYELDGYLTSDINAYAATFALGTPSLQNILVNGFSGSPTSGVNSARIEVTLDIELALALAPAAKVLVYEADNSSAGSLAIYNRIANDNLASVVSVSYGLAEEAVSDTERTSESTIFQKMVTQGQCVYVSSGDNGAYNPTTSDANGNPTDFLISVSDPASQPYVVAVGGTKLSSSKAPVTLANPDPLRQYVLETTWNTFAAGELPSATTKAGATGGGISKYFAKPDFQAGVGASLTLPAATGGTVTPMRDVPDVALNADPHTGYTIYDGLLGPYTLNGVTGYDIVGGTSASAPLWAAFNILVNQKRAAFGLGRLGFANPDIYAIAQSANYSTTFHDINDNATNLVYQTGAGYDDTTGWGSFIGDALLAKLAPSTSSPQTLTVTVTDANGAAIAGADVVVTTPQIALFSTAGTTKADGTFTIALDSLLQSSVTATAVPLTYTVRAEKSGYAGTTVKSVAVPATLVVTLTAPDHVFAGATTLQMISAPYDYTTAGDFLSLFNLTSAQIVTGGPNLIAYSPALSRYLLYPNVPADTLRLGQGYWARLPADGTVRRHGTLAPTNQSFRINLAAGWNQIGDPFLTAVPVSSLQVDGTLSPGAPVGISSSADVSLPLYSYPGTSASTYAQIFADGTLQPWAGYWIFAKKAVTLVVPPPGG